MLAVTVMPGPQTVAAIPVCRWFKEHYPGVPIVWGGYFPSIYPDTALNANYVDFVVRGQGEETFVELLGRARRAIGRFAEHSRAFFQGCSSGCRCTMPERPLRSPGDFPVMPYHRLDREVFAADVSRIAHDGASGEHRVSVINAISAAWWIFRDRAEKMEPPERTASRCSGKLEARLRRERGAVLRQQFLHARGSGARTCRADDAAGHELVVRDARGRDAAVFG